jgi:hypothetical protein
MVRKHCTPPTPKIKLFHIPTFSLFSPPPWMSPTRGGGGGGVAVAIFFPIYEADSWLAVRESFLSGPPGWSPSPAPPPVLAKRHGKWFSLFHFECRIISNNGTGKRSRNGETTKTARLDGPAQILKVTSSLLMIVYIVDPKNYIPVFTFFRKWNFSLLMRNTYYWPLMRTTCRLYFSFFHLLCNTFSLFMIIFFHGAWINRNIPNCWLPYTSAISFHRELRKRKKNLVPVPSKHTISGKQFSNKFKQLSKQAVETNYWDW